MERESYASIVIGFVLSLSIFTYAAGYGGGSGSSENPYLIYTPAQMNTIGANSGDWGKAFKLMADINMAGIGYNIIGNETTPFSGTFNGNGHVIRNLTYSTAAAVKYVGAFGFILNGTVQNWGLKISPFQAAGILSAGWPEITRVPLSPVTPPVLSVVINMSAGWRGIRITALFRTVTQPVRSAAFRMPADWWDSSISAP